LVDIDGPDMMRPASHRVVSILQSWQSTRSQTYLMNTVFMRLVSGLLAVMHAHIATSLVARNIVVRRRLFPGPRPAGDQRLSYWTLDNFIGRRRQTKSAPLVELLAFYVVSDSWTSSPLL
jgi:hypothetical protein